MILLRRAIDRLNLPTRVAAGAVAMLLLGGASARCAITITADPGYPPFPSVFTTDASIVANGNRGITADRNLRQTFKNPTTIDVGEIVLGFDVNTFVGGMIIDFYEVDDVNAAMWTPGALIHTISIPDLTVNTSERLGITLTDSDVFELPARFTGTTGYGIELSNFDLATTIGTWFHTNDSVDHYPDGVFYIESGELSGADPLRDVGVALLDTNAPPATPGDVDGDTDVDLEDLEIIAANFRQTVGTRTMGDLTGDRFVDVLDFRNWKSNYPDAFPGFKANWPNVPEPATLLSALTALAAASSWRRARSRIKSGNHHTG